jgi:hypothetical protein
VVLLTAANFGIATAPAFVCNAVQTGRFSDDDDSTDAILG